jgi:anti-sigma regulatory factor (Ser/Thr protein kinase)
MRGSGLIRDRLPPSFAHSAFLYDTDDSYVAVLVPFLREGLARDERVAVATSPDRIGLLTDALDGDAAEVTFLPDDEWYVRPVRTIAGWARMLTGSARRTPYTRLVGQVRFGAADQHQGWVRFESALNRSLAGANGHLLCPYDRRDLPSDLLEAAGRTHPLMCDGSWFDSDSYLAPERLMAEVPEPAWPVTGEPVLILAVADTVAGLRDEVRGRARAEGWLADDRLDDLVLALSEVATNGVRHGGGHRELRVWLSADAVVCEVTDEGPHPPDPLAGYLPPAPGAIGGMGLWLSYQVCDSMSIHTADGVTRARFAIRRG